MNSAEKQQVVSTLGADFSSAAACFLVDHQGCTCKELTALRRELKPVGAKFAVVKNTLAKRAVADTVASGLAAVFEGPTAVVWSGQDVVAPAKALSKFAKTKESFKIKAGVVEGKVVGGAEIEELAALPSREEVLAKLLAVINAPATRLMQTINAPAGQLVRLLDAWRAEIEKR